MFEQRFALALGILVVAHASTAPLSPQIVSGQVLDLNSGLPVGTGFIVLVDEEDQEVARTLSTSAGHFLLRAPSEGVYRLRSERIGYHAHTSDPFEIAADTSLVYAPRVVALPVKLATVEVTGEDLCGVHPEVGAATSLVWEQIRKALTATVWSASEELFRFRRYNYERDWDVSLKKVTDETGHTVDGLANQPYWSLPATQLAAEGYVVERDDGNWYYLPERHIGDFTFTDSTGVVLYAFKRESGHIAELRVDAVSGHYVLVRQPR